MKCSKKLAAALNDQITLELGSAIAYRQLAADMEALSLSGIANWFMIQSCEEVLHMDKFIAHLLDRGGHPRIGTIKEQGEPVTTVLAAFEASLAHEQKVTKSILNLYKLSQEEGDYPVQPLLHWFIDEQVEEEASVEALIDRVKLAGNEGSALLELDRELAQRTAGPGVPTPSDPEA